MIKIDDNYSRNDIIAKKSFILEKLNNMVSNRGSLGMTRDTTCCREDFIKELNKEIGFPAFKEMYVMFLGGGEEI